jgi:hypothetical protein
MAKMTDIQIAIADQDRERIDKLAHNGQARVVREPLTYERSSSHSYFRDLALSEQGNNAAAGRMARHASEMQVEVPQREERDRQRAQDSGLEFRVNPDRTAGQGGSFAPPLWLIDEFASAPRPGRVVTQLAPRFPLPAGCQSVNLPRLTTATKTRPVADLAPGVSQDIADAQVASPVVTITGQGDVPVQLLEQSPPGPHLDWAIFKDLTADYDAQLETQTLTGSGNGTEFWGLLKLQGKVEVTFTDGSPTGAKMFTVLGQLAAQIGDARLLPPEVWLMRTARWAWLGSAQDDSHMPLSVPGHTPPYTPIPHLFDDARPTPVAPLLGWPIYLNDAIPANLNTNQDAVVGCRPSDLIVLESEPRTAVMFEPLSGTLQARLQLHRYAAVITGRYPSGVGTLTGTGLAVQPGF